MKIPQKGRWLEKFCIDILRRDKVTNRELDADIVKKIEARLSGNWQQKKK